MSDDLFSGDAHASFEDSNDPKDVLARAEEYGVDLSQLRERLKLTPTERAEQHRAGLEFATDLRKACGGASSFSAQAPWCT